MPLKNRRQEYSWAESGIRDFRVATDKKDYGIGEKIAVNASFRIIGGVREAFHPDVWTVAWEDFDKIIRLTFGLSVGVRRGPLFRKAAEIKKEVRKASFYWSRDPDLPYRIWAMIVPEGGGAPLIPLNVEDAKAKMFDVAKNLEIPAASLGAGQHSISAAAYAKWGRRSFIEKGALSGTSEAVLVHVG